MYSLLNIFDSVERFDHWLFKKINGEWTNPVFDFICVYLRQQDIWMPLYLFLFVFVAINFKKNWWWWVILFLCTVALTDMTGTKVFKNAFERKRPCDDPDFIPYVRMLLKHCAGSFSFVSNHAANHFGIAAFVHFTLRSYFPKWTWLFFLWAFAIVYSQIYVGIHYPTDVIGGALLGLLFGTFMAMFFNKRFGFANFGKQPTVIL